MKNEDLKRIARYCVTSGTQNTTNGKWSVSYDELSHHFDVDKTDINGNAQLLTDMLNQQEEINDLMMTEDCIEMTYHMEHCPLCRQGGIAGALALSSVLGCNITDEHEEPKYKPLPYDEVETKLARQILWLYAGEGKANFLPNMFLSNMRNIVRESDNRNNRMLFKLAVEIAMVENILANLSKYDPLSVERLRGQCIEEVKGINGMMQFEDAVDWQESWRK